MPRGLPAQGKLRSWSIFFVGGLSISRMVQKAAQMNRAGRYHAIMKIRGLSNYLSTTLPLELNAEQHFRLLRNVFALVFASVVVIHLLIRHDQTALGMLIHATFIGLVYSVGVGLAAALLYALHDRLRRVRVWHLWAVSLIGYILGYFFLPFDFFINWFPLLQDEARFTTMGFLQLLPVWFLITYLFVQPYLGEGLRLELARLQEINALLENRDRGGPRNGEQLIHFESGRTRFTLDANTIRNIVVEDHYCYIHYQSGGGYAKRDLGIPLREMLALLPQDFVQVHRSHIVNLEQIVSISRINRNTFLILSGDYGVPVSRHRLEDVLPLIRQER